MTETTAALAWIRHKVEHQKAGQVLAIIGQDAVWVDGKTMTLSEYAAAYGDRARQEVRVDGLSLAQLGAPFF